VIGERTPGAANPGRRYPVNALFEVTVPNGTLRSAVTGRNWEGTGVTPDIIVPESDALRLAHSRALQRLIAAAEGDWRIRLERELKALDPIQ
jgi:C-terminal processing protease CtpA/Prc